MALQPAPAPYRFTVEEYDRLGDVGFFDEDSRVELVEGEIIQLAAVGNHHAQCVRRLIEWFGEQLVGQTILDVRNPVRPSDDSEPEPDVVLLVEVCDSSLMWDRNRKVPLYARAGVPEVWLVDLVGGAVEVYRQPEGDDYTDVTRVAGEGRVAPAAFPGAEIEVAALLR